MIELFEFALSGNCHKIRLMLSLLGLNYKSHLLNGAAREHKSPEFLALNSFGQTPVLKDGEIIVRDSQAILVYLARAYGEEDWFPNDATKAAKITEWLSVAANEIARGPGALRLHYKFGRAISVEDAQAITETILQILNQHLMHHDWLANNTITIADLAIYPYLALAHEGKVDLSPFMYVENWIGRIEMLAGFVTMEGIQLRNNR